MNAIPGYGVNTFEVRIEGLLTELCTTECAAFTTTAVIHKKRGRWCRSSSGWEKRKAYLLALVQQYLTSIQCGRPIDDVRGRRHGDSVTSAPVLSLLCGKPRHPIQRHESSCAQTLGILVELTTTRSYGFRARLFNCAFYGHDNPFVPSHVDIEASPKAGANLHLDSNHTPNPNKSINHF